MAFVFISSIFKGPTLSWCCGGAGGGAGSGGGLAGTGAKEAAGRVQNGKSAATRVAPRAGELRRNRRGRHTHSTE